MSEKTIAAVNSFLARPNAENALQFINSNKKMIINMARAWYCRHISLEEKIMSELLLILLEDFSADKVKHPHALLSFLYMKIRRLTHNQRRFEMAFGSSADMSELGRCNFCAMRLDLVEEIFQTVRRCILQAVDPGTGLLEFLFIHVYPEVNWASRLLAQESGLDEITRLNADKKRHARFNSLLHSELKKLKSGEFHEIKEWSGGERSHLAWRLISISPEELDATGIESLEFLEHWRETIDRRQPQLVSNLVLARKVYSSMRKCSVSEISVNHGMAEEAEIYGEQPDIILQLLGHVSERNQVRESEESWESNQNVNIDQSTEMLFAKVASEVCQWFSAVEKTKSIDKKMTSGQSKI